MPALPTQNLPNQQPSVESMLTNEINMGKQQIQDRFNKAWDQMGTQAFQQNLPVKQRDAAMQQLHTQFSQEYAEFEQKAALQTQRLKEVDNLVSSGNIPVSDAPRIKMQLFRPELAREMYKPPSKPDVSFSENQKNDYAKAAQTFIGNVPLQGNWLTGRTAELSGITSMYTQWKRDIAYEVKNPTEQRQLDDVWDSMIQGNNTLADKWFQYDKDGNQYVASPIRAERAKYWAGGPAAKAVADRKSSLPVSPIGSVVKGMVGAAATPEMVAPEQHNRETYSKQMGTTDYGRWYPNAKEPVREVKKLDVQTAMQIMTEAGGNANRAREIAKKRGYTF